jgi:flagellar biosynthesis/type III secretory pathway chaperone
MTSYNLEDIYHVLTDIADNLERIADKLSSRTHLQALKDKKSLLLQIRRDTQKNSPEEHEVDTFLDKTDDIIKQELWKEVMKT